MTKTIYQECVDIVRALVGHEYLFFDTAIEVKITPYNFAFNAWAVCASPKNELFVMDTDEKWHQIELTDDNAALVIGSLYQRLKLMRINYAKAS